MLLGAEVTTDTSGNLRWLSLAGAGVAVLVLVIFGFPIASNLLSEEGLAPRIGTSLVRVINAVPGAEGETFTVVEGDFDVPLETEVTTTVSLDAEEESAEPVTIENVVYNDEREEIREYVEVESGVYTVNVTVSDGSYETSPIYSETLDLEPKSAQSIVVYENIDGIIDVLLLEDDISPTDMGAMRMKLFNAVADQTVSLVDVGQYSTLQTLCEDESCSSLVPHRVLIDAVPFGETTTIDLDEGTYNLAFVNEDNDVLRNIQEYEAERGVVETRVLVLEPGQLNGLPVYRAAVFGAVGSAPFGSPEAIGQVLFIDYLLPVQLVGILLLVALIGVIVLARPDALAQQERRRINRRRRVSRPLVSVLSQQTGSDVLSGEYLAKLTEGSDDDDDDPDSK